MDTDCAPRLVAPQNDSARRNAGSGGHQNVLDVRYLVDGRPANLANTFGDAVHCVDLGLTELSAMRVDRECASEMDATEETQVAVSGIIGSKEIRIQTKAKSQLIVRMLFMEPKPIGKGERLFDVTLRGKSVLTDFDIVDQAGGALRSIAREFSLASDDGKIVLRFEHKSELPAIICGIEIIVESAK